MRVTMRHARLLPKPGGASQRSRVVRHFCVRTVYVSHESCASSARPYDPLRLCLCGYFARSWVCRCFTSYRTALSQRTRDGMIPLCTSRNFRCFW